ncbi:MAG: C40 family peptidase, partial [Bosea sp. (in: a-proteobacteria)]
RGEAVTVYERFEGWAWAQLAGDGYVGYLPETALGAVIAPATHRVSAQRTFLYPGPSMKLPPLDVLSLGAMVTVARIEGSFAVLPTGACLWAAHLAPVSTREPDFVTVAERFLHVPYLWGGKTSLGLDCSGLTQVALAASGIAAPRDSDQQEAALGSPLPINDSLSGLNRGDLVFWKGHVGIMRDADTLLHATGYSMTVMSEPLREARDRILTGSFGAITSIRRL